MRLGERWVNGVAVIDVAGSITGAYPSPLKDLVCKLVRRGDARIVINLQDVAYIDSAGLGMLVACYTRATRGDAGIVLASAKPRVYELLAMTNMLSIFDIYDTETHAVESFAVAA